MTERMPAWLGQWLGVEMPTDGSSAVWQLRSAWPWAPWATVLLVLFAVGWVAYFYSRENTAAGRAYRGLLAALRLGVIAILLFMLTELVLTVTRTGPPGIVLLIDRSASMQIVDQSYEQAEMAVLQERLATAGIDTLSRLNLAKLIVTQGDAQLLKKLATEYRLQTYFVAEGIERQPSELAELVAAVDGLEETQVGTQETRLGDAIRQALRELPGGPPAAIVLLSDGVNTAGTSLQEAAELARRRGVPIFAVGLGSDRATRDLGIADVLVDDVVFVDDLVSFQATIKATGLVGQQAQVTLRRAEDPTPLASESITLRDDGQPQEVRLTHRPTEPGEVSYVVEIEPREDEVDVDNNQSRYTVSIRDEKIRVLLAFGYPSYEFRYLKNLLERDRSVEVSTYLQEADADYVALDETAISAYPVARDALLEYDVVILGDVDPRLLPRSTWQNLEGLVAEKGGGIAMLAGPRYFPAIYGDLPVVARLLPIELDNAPILGRTDGVQGFTPQPTPLGMRTASMQLGTSLESSQAIWQSLPPVYWLAQTGPAKPAAQVLAVHPLRSGADGQNLPVICLQYVGNGRVLYHAIDETWRWRFRVGDVYFARYWVQTIRLLARAKLTSRGGAELTTDRREYRLGEPIELRTRFFDQRLAPTGATGVEVLVESSGRQRERVALDRNPTVAGVFEGTLTGLEPGTYRVLLVEPTIEGATPAARFRVTTPLGELARVEMDRAALESAATTTHGKFYPAAAADDLLRELPAGRPVPIESLPALPIWNHPLPLLLLLGMLIAEWLLRRRAGML